MGDRGRASARAACYLPRLAPGGTVTRAAAVTVSGARNRMLSDDAPTPMSNTPGSTAEPIVPPWYHASCEAGSVNVTRVVSCGFSLMRRKARRVRIGWYDLLFT